VRKEKKLLSSSFLHAGKTLCVCCACESVCVCERENQRERERERGLPSTPPLRAGRKLRVCCGCVWVWACVLTHFCVCAFVCERDVDRGKEREEGERASLFLPPACGQNTVNMLCVCMYVCVHARSFMRVCERERDRKRESA